VENLFAVAIADLAVERAPAAQLFQARCLLPMTRCLLRWRILQFGLAGVSPAGGIVGGVAGERTSGQCESGKPDENEITDRHLAFYPEATIQLLAPLALHDDAIDLLRWQVMVTYELAMTYLSFAIAT
jgi:hypothetical protein